MCIDNCDVVYGKNTISDSRRCKNISLNNIYFIKKYSKCEENNWMEKN